MNNEDRKLIAIQHCNKLIAEFMGYRVFNKDTKCYSPKYDDGTIAPMQFDKSWDWLMPVVNKCYKTGDDTHQWDDLMDAMFTCDISIVYEQVVEFIKEYNRTTDYNKVTYYDEQG